MASVRSARVPAAADYPAILRVTCPGCLGANGGSDGVLSLGICVQSLRSSGFPTRTWSGSCLDEDKKALRAQASLKNLLESRIQ